MNNIIVISVGGSLIAPDEIDTGFLKEFRDLVLRYVKQGKRFVIIAGGGRTARKYQRAAQAVAKITDEELDWLGITATRMNASLLKTFFIDIAHKKIISDPSLKIDFKEKVLIATGWKPGFSTDYDAVLLANQVGAGRLINLTDVDYVYNKDPDKFEDAKPIKKTSWREFRNILPKDWSPGLSAPFDPVAAKEAEKLGLEVAIIDGKHLERAADYLDGKEFVGTVVY